MAQDKRYTRVQQKIDTTANWNKATNFKPLEGEVVIYQDAGDTVPKIKIGHADTLVGDLPFITETIEANIDALTEATTDLVYYSDGNREVAVVPINADLLGSQPPSYYATAEAASNIQSVAENAKSTADNAQTVANGAMPKTGGTFTGDVNFSVGGKKVWISFTDENGTATDEPYIHWEE